MSNENDSRFLTTQWTRILASDGSSTDSVSSGLTRLCETYHQPVYAFIRHRCHDPEKARDLCQGFFEMLIETGFYKKAEREKGRFRTYLLAAVKNYLNEDYRKSQRLKRGGDKIHLSLDLDEAELGFRGELSSESKNEAAFDHDWAVTVFDQVWLQLRSEYESAGHLDRYTAIHPILVDPSIRTSYADLGSQLGLSENGIKTVVHRMKARFRALFRDHVGRLVEHPGDIDEEISYLIQCTTRDPYC